MRVIDDIFKTKRVKLYINKTSEDVDEINQKKKISTFLAYALTLFHPFHSKNFVVTKINK